MSLIVNNSTKNKKNFRTKLGEYTFELFVVFLGVYLAFLFTDYQEEIEEHKTRIKYYDALVFEFKIFAEHLETENIKIEKHMSVLDDISEGTKPRLLVTDFYYLYQGAVVNSAFNSKNFESLDKDTLTSIIGGIPLLLLLDKKIAKIEQLTQAVLFPMLMKPDSVYFDTDGNLVAALQWYPELIKSLQQTNRKLHTIISKYAVPQLEQQKQKMIKQYSFLF